MIRSESIYDCNFNDNQITFLRETGLTKEPMIMKAIEDFYIKIKKPGCYTGSHQILVKKGTSFFAHKEKNHAIIQCEDGVCFITSIRWPEYVKLKQTNVFVPITVFTIS
ncbi:MAG: hypothetical protein MRY57_00360 [Candidatus Pacebacteria bacterium]|nr:hypothetical protein [Candidatus Paceibacterota bacterium]